MKNFMRIFSGKNGESVEKQVNGLAEEQNLEIVNATSFMWQGVIYTTAVFEERAKTREKKEAQNE